MLLHARRVRRFLLWSLCTGVFLCAQDERPRLTPSPATYDKTIVSEIHFYGDNELARQEQSRFEELYKAECECDDAVKELTERVRYLYQQHGYFKAEVQSTPHSLRSDEGHPRVSVDIEIKQVLEYKFGPMELTGQKVFSAEQLRSLFSIQSGEVFDVEKIREGLDNLRKVYGERGYINVTPVPKTKPDDARVIIDLSIDIDEGPQFRIGTIAFSGTGAADTRFQDRMLKSLRMKSGDIFDSHLLEVFFEENRSWLPPGSTVEDHVEIAQNARQGTVDLYFVFK